MKTVSVYLPTFLALFLGVAWFAQAQTSTPETDVDGPRTEQRQQVLENQQQRQDDRLEQRTENVEARQEVRQDRQTALSEVRQKRVINLAANISNRVDAAVRRLENIANRLESRMQKLADRGVDTTEAARYLSEARNTLTNISERMNTIDTIVYGSVTSATPRESWQSVKMLFEGVHGDLMSAREALRSAVAALKEAVATAETGSTTGNASSSQMQLTN